MQNTKNKMNSFHTLINKFLLYIIKYVLKLCIKRDVDATGSQSATVNSPNVTMKITDRSGSDIVSAQVGDPLMLRFEIMETSSKFNN
jgi:hypothetical protein